MWEDAIRVEWELWQKVCKELLRLGAITQEDLNANTMDRYTNGERLLALIREWGNALVVLHR